MILKLWRWSLIAGIALAALWTAFMLLHFWHEWNTAGQVIALVQSRCPTCATEGDIWRMYFRSFEEFAVYGLAPLAVLLLMYLATGHLLRALAHRANDVA